MDEYDLLYEEYYGFEFELGVTDISKPIPMSKKKVESIEKCKTVTDDKIPVFVKCKTCDEYLDYGYGYFKCKCCGKEIKEMDLYSIMDEDLDYEKYWD